MRLPANVSDSIKKLNPDVFGVGAVAAEKPEPDRRSQSEDRKLESSASSMGYRITFVAMRRRLLDDHDNARAALKPLVDAVARSLGFDDDSDPHLAWEYHQVKTSGREGVAVKLEVL